MANSAVVGTLRALLMADTSEFVSATKKAGDASEDMARDMTKAAASFEAAGARMSSVTRLVKDFSGSLETRKAHEWSMAIEQIGGAAKLSETELRRASGVFNDYISKAQAMGQEVPAHIRKVSSEIENLRGTSSKSIGVIDQIKGAFSNLGPTALAAAGGFATALISVEALTQGFRAAVQFIKQSIDQYAEAEKAQRKLTAAMVAQKTATPEATQAMKDLADQFQKTTVFSDDLITEMETLLITVGSVMPSQMEDALQAATNLASGLGIDLRQATMLVAKASEDNFTSLKKVIPAFDEAAAKAGGMANVLEQVNKEFGGQAAADMQTFAGQLQATENAFGELQETVGEAIVKSTAFQIAFTLIRAELNKVTAELEFFLTTARGLSAMPGPIGNAFRLLVGDLNATANGIDEVNSRIAEFRRMQGGMQAGAGIWSDYTNFSKALEDVKKKLSELTPAQLKEIEAAKALGANLDEVAKRYGFTAKELNLLTSAKKEHKKAVDEVAKAYAEWASKVTGAGLLKDLGTLEDRLAKLTKEGLLTARAQKEIADEAAKLGKELGFLPPKLQTLVNQFHGFGSNVVTATTTVPKLNAALTVTGKQIDTLGAEFVEVNKKFAEFNKIIDTSGVKMNQFLAKLPGAVSGKDIKEMQAGIQTFAEKAGEALQDVGGDFLQLGNAIGGTAGEVVASVGAIAQGIGRLVSGDIIGGLTSLTAAFAKFAKGLTRNIARDMQDAFATTELGFANLNTLMARLRELGAVDLVNRGDRAQRKDDEKETRKWMEDVRKFLDEVDRKAEKLFSGLADAAEQFGGKAPAALQPMIQELLRINALTEEQRALLEGLAGEPAWQDLQRIADTYGISLEALGSKFQNARIGDMALQYARDFNTLKEAGGDVNGLLEGMQDEVQALVIDALKFGTSMPEAMRPVLQGLIDMGKLTDENGNKLENLDRFQFSGTFEDIFKDMKTVLEEIRDLLAAKVPTAAEEGAKKTRTAFGGAADFIRSKFRDPVEVRVEFRAGSFSPPEGFSVDSAQEGGMVTKTGLVNVHAGEVIGPLNELDLGREVRVDNRLYIDGREVTVSVVQNMREVARRLGVRPI